MKVFETRDRDLLRGAFLRDPIGAIYQLGDLESPVFEQCRWLVAADGGEVRAVVLLYGDLPAFRDIAIGEDTVTLGSQLNGTITWAAGGEGRRKWVTGLIYHD